MIYRHISELIGNTPLFQIDPAIHGLKNIDVYAKLEYWNPFGSVKDRIGWSMVRDLLPQLQKEGKTIIESSSGNTAKALQAIASVHGIGFKTITNRIKEPEVRQVLQVLGADIEELPGRSECPDPNDPDTPFSRIEALLRSEKGDRYYYTNQYVNEKNLSVHYETTGQEINDDLSNVDYFVGGLGTTGSTRGTAMRVKEKNPSLESIGVVSSPADFIPGIRTANELWEVGLFDRSFYKDIVIVHSHEGIEGMLTLIRRCGLLAGPTSGASYMGMLNYLRPIDETLTERKTAVFIACDRFEWYMSYIRKRKPEIFGSTQQASTIASLTDEQISCAPVVVPHEASAWIQEHRPLLIDTRSNVAFRTAHIADSVNIPQELFVDMIEGAQPFPKSKKLLLICPLGDQSKRIAAYLQSVGYQAFSLQEGITGWRDAALPLASISTKRP